MSARIDYSNIGEVIDEMEVVISYRIINLFSGHLYSSPTKAIEELVVNSYDAFADTCHVIVPKNLAKAEARIVVYDNGEGMDENGIRELWLTADTRKRDPEREEESRKKGRLPIGKFGIGKLASCS
jgi:HSP90 family molecular chaperone